MLLLPPLLLQCGQVGPCRPTKGPPLPRMPAAAQLVRTQTYRDRFHRLSSPPDLPAAPQVGMAQTRRAAKRKGTGADDTELVDGGLAASGACSVLFRSLPCSLLFGHATGQRFCCRSATQQT